MFWQPQNWGTVDMHFKTQTMAARNTWQSEYIVVTQCRRVALIGPYFINSLAPGRPRCHFKTAIFNIVLLIGIFTSSKDNALRWMPRDLTDDKSTLAWCSQATSHYLSQCWPCLKSSYGVTRPQWVKCIVFAGKCCILITQWHHQMEIFSTLLAFCAGNSPVTVMKTALQFVPKGPVGNKSGLIQVR